MNPQTLVIKKVLAVVLPLLLIIVLAILLLSRGGEDIEYSPSSTNNRAGPIVIKARSNIDPDAGSLSISPSVPGDVQIIENYIVFWPLDGEGFTEGKSYTATFKDYQLKGGNKLNIPRIRFKVDRNTDYTALQREALSKFGRFEGALNPFLTKLPYTEPYKFRITYRINELRENEGKSNREILGDERNWREKKANYTVLIETLVVQGNDDSLQTYINDVTAARNAAMTWIKSQGVNPDKDILYAFIPTDEQLKSPGGEPEIELD